MHGLRSIWVSLRAAGSRLCRSEDGPTTAEYAVMLAVIVVAAITGLETLGDGVRGLYVAIEGALTLT